MIAQGGAKLHFVDDRFETVQAIAADPHLSALPKFQTYFATWCAAAHDVVWSVVRSCHVAAFPEEILVVSRISRRMSGGQPVLLQPARSRLPNQQQSRLLTTSVPLSRQSLCQSLHRVGCQSRAYNFCAAGATAPRRSGKQRASWPECAAYRWSSSTSSSSSASSWASTTAVRITSSVVSGYRSTTAGRLYPCAPRQRARARELPRQAHRLTMPVVARCIGSPLLGSTTLGCPSSV